MKNPEKIDISQRDLTPMSKIRIDSKKGIETIFLTDRFLPNKEEIKRYFFDNKLLNKQEALEIANKKKISMPKDKDKYKFFIYHTSLGIVSFQKGDFVITDEGYATTDGKNVLCYDNNGEELGFF